MARTIEEVLAGLEPARRDMIKARAAERIREVRGLQQIRKLTGKSQAHIAKVLGVKQPAVAQMEKRTDVYLSTLRDFIEAAGGKLELRVEFPGMEPVRLSGFEDLHPTSEEEAA